MLEKEVAELEARLHSNDENAHILAEKKKRLLNQAKIDAQEKIHALNESFEKEKGAIHEQLEKEVEEYEQKKLQQSAKELQHIQQLYEERKVEAVEKMIKEVLVYDYRKNE